MAGTLGGKIPKDLDPQTDGQIESLLLIVGRIFGVTGTSKIVLQVASGFWASVRASAGGGPLRGSRPLNAWSSSGAVVVTLLSFTHMHHNRIWMPTLLVV